MASTRKAYSGSWLALGPSTLVGSLAVAHRSFGHNRFVLERLRSHLETTGLIPSGARVLVGYSGGADSTCLLHLLKLLGVDLVAAHLHHGQRPEAEAELEACEAFAHSIGVAFISGKADVPRMSDELGIGLEEAGRKARYAFLEQATRHYGCQRIATAHTLTDHVETILHHFVRGAGLTGLSGIPSERGNLIRPLLPFERAETRAYVREHNLPFHDDPANSDLSFSRGRIRHRILPELAAINPAALQSIARTAGIVSAEDRFLNGMAAAALEQCETPLNGELAFLTQDVEIGLDKAKLAGLPEVLFRRAVRLAVEALGGQLDSHQTDAIVLGVSERSRGSITAVGGGVVVEWCDERMHIRELIETAPYRHALTYPGETISDPMGWRLTAFCSNSSDEAPKRASLEVELDESALKGDLYFRSAAKADEVRPLGFEGRRKVSDIMSEAKLTSAARSRLPLICDMIGPIWIPGVCLDERARSRKPDSKVVVLRFEPNRSAGSHNGETSALR